MKGDQDEEEEVINFGSSRDTAERSRTEEAANKKIEEIYGKERVNEKRRKAAKQRYVVLKPSQFDDPEIITLLEMTPTYNRDPKLNKQIAEMGEAGVSGDSIFNQNNERPSGENIISF